MGKGETNSHKKHGPRKLQQRRYAILHKRDECSSQKEFDHVSGKTHTDTGCLFLSLSLSNSNITTRCRAAPPDPKRLTFLIEPQQQQDLYLHLNELFLNNIDE